MTESTLDRPPDPRRTPWRPDIAAAGLEGRVPSKLFVPGKRLQVVRPLAPIRRHPDPAAGVETEALFGEVFTAYETTGGWSWGQLETDGYVGYVPADMLAGPPLDASLKVRVMATWVFPRPDIKAPAVMPLYLGSRLAVAETDERFVRLATGGFVFARHVGPLANHARDFVDVAERLVETPYLWGGRSRAGLDCSGLVQLAMQAAGLDAPRDSDMQCAEIGSGLAVPADLEGLQRGDLVFWNGHVGIMVDGMMMIHANAHHMTTVVEPLAMAASRIARTGGEVTAIRRPPALAA